MAFRALNPRKNVKATLAGAAVIVVGFTYLSAEDAPRTQASEYPPFALSRDSVSNGKGAYNIGDLKIVDGPRARMLQTTVPDSRDLENCIRRLPQWLHRSADGATLEVSRPYGSPSEERVLTASCEDGVILVGGEREVVSDYGERRKQAWLFSMVERFQSSPIKVVFTDDGYGVGPRGHRVDYRLTALRSIDPESGTMLFDGVSEKGTPATLSAPFAVRSRRR